MSKCCPTGTLVAISGTRLTEDTKYYHLSGDEISPSELLTMLPDGRHHARPDTTADDLPQTNQPQTRKKFFSTGRLLDFLLPVVLALGIFYGFQTFLNSDGSGIRIQLGAAMLLKITLITTFIYMMVIRPILKSIFSSWWPQEQKG
jgi:hypothetical protein